MKIKWSLIIFSVVTTIACQQEKEHPKLPTDGTIIRAENIEEYNKREKWLDLLHKSAQADNWKEIEASNAMKLHIQRRESKPSARADVEVLANGALTGEWLERGSRNLAGRILATQYDAKEDMVYMVSAGGSLWKGPSDGSAWEVVNQDLQFNSRFFRFIETANGRRILGLINKVPHFSDDDGYNWSPSTGLTTYDNWGARQTPVLSPENENLVLQVVQEWLPGPWRPDVGIYKSTNQGETYERIVTYGEQNPNHFELVVPSNDSNAYLVRSIDDDSTGIFMYNTLTGEFDMVSGYAGIRYNNRNVNLTATTQLGQTTFYTYDDSLKVYRSNDLGNTWELRGQMENAPWAVGLWVSPSDSDFLLYGNIECYRSPDAGLNWSKINNWGAYYGDVENKLHADMMFFNEFEKSTGDKFILISNDGGLNISYDFLNTTPNIGLSGLNVSQYYSVRTDPSNPLFIYAGSQDQGFQRGFSFSDNVMVNFQQVISGDYGHIVFTGNGSHLWTVYPGGWVTYYSDPQNSGFTYSWEVDSDDETVWIPPLMSSADPSEDNIYLAGGNAEGGPGSHIIQLSADFYGGITAEQNPFDFKLESGGEISAMEISPLNPDKWYVATSNGLFYFSEDNGTTWDVSVQVGPNPQYLYGSTILASRFDEDVVYFGGSGYSTFPVYKSLNGGQTFIPISDGLPRTVVIEITSNADESMLFAASEAGPYVYLAEEDQWYPMHGEAAPAQRYWTVEFLEEKDIVRFGTYGRGIWDFQISEVTTSLKDTPVENEILIYPNPASDYIMVKTTETEFTLELFTMDGKQVMFTRTGRNQKINISDLNSGTYIVHINGETIGENNSLIVVQ